MQVLEEQKIIDYEFIIILFKLLQVKNGFIELDDSKANTKEVETKKEDPIVEVKEEKKDEREEYSDGVKKRIDRLTYKIREAERREKEALSFAEQVKKERDDLQTKFTKDLLERMDILIQE